MRVVGLTAVSSSATGRLDTALDDAPLVWVCGDLHLENFGSFHGDDGRANFDVNDFDEAALAPASWDLARLLTSLHLAEKLPDVASHRALVGVDDLASG